MVGGRHGESSAVDGGYCVHIPSVFSRLFSGPVMSGRFGPELDGWLWLSLDETEVSVLMVGWLYIQVQVYVPKYLCILG